MRFKLVCEFRQREFFFSQLLYTHLQTLVNINELGSDRHVFKSEPVRRPTLDDEIAQLLREDVSTNRILGVLL